MDLGDDLVEQIQIMKAFKNQIDRESLLVGYHPFRWLDWCVPVNDKKQIEMRWKNDQEECAQSGHAAW